MAAPLLTIHFPKCPETKLLDDWGNYGCALASSLQQLSQWVTAESLRLRQRFQTKILPHYGREAFNARFDTSKAAARLRHAVTRLHPFNDQSTWAATMEFMTTLTPPPSRPPPPPSPLITAGQVSTVRAPEEDFVHNLLYPRLPPPPTVVVESDDDDENSTVAFTMRLPPVLGDDDNGKVVLHYAITMLVLYYLDCTVAADEQWTKTWLHSEEKSRMSFQVMVFLELMHLFMLRSEYAEQCISQAERARVADHIRRGQPLNEMAELYRFGVRAPRGAQPLLSQDAAAYAALAANLSTFPTLAKRQLMLPRDIPVSRYTQSEFEQAILSLMYKLNRVEWSTELHHYIYLLIDRMAVLLSRTHPASVLNVPAMRTVMSLTARQSLRALQQIETPASMDMSYAYNYDFLVRCNWHFYYLMKVVFGFEQLLQGPIDPFAPSIPVQNVDLLLHLSSYSRDQVQALAAHLEDWVQAQFARYQVSELGSIEETLRRDITAALVPDGDLEWMQFKYPIINATPHNILDKLHDGVYANMRAEVFPVQSYQVVQRYLRDHKAADAPLHFIYLRLVLLMFNKHLVEGLESLRFSEQYLIQNKNLHLLSSYLFHARVPMVQQWLGRYYLVYNNTLSTAATNIFEVLAEWVLIAQYYCPDLWEELLVYGKTILPAALLNTQITEEAQVVVNTAKPPLLLVL